MKLTPKVKAFLDTKPSDTEIYTQIVLGNFNTDDIKSILEWNETSYVLNPFTVKNITEIYELKIDCLNKDKIKQSN